MERTSWRTSLDLALERNREAAPSRFMQLATVRADGRPSNRTVVFRGFLGDSDRILVTTDVRSAKFRELESHPWAEVCWYFPRTREQFRLGARVTIVGEATGDRALREARLDAWRRLTEATRQTFTWPTTGAPREPEAAFLEGPPDESSPLPSFGVLVLDPDEIDHLELDGRPQGRRIWRRDEHGVWTSIEVNP